MRLRALWALVVFGLAGYSQAANWDWTHQAYGGGSANVTDNPWAVTDFDQTENHDSLMTFTALDQSQNGTTTYYNVSGSSQVSVNRNNHFAIDVLFDASYVPSEMAGGTLGGIGRGSVISIVELAMPPANRLGQYQLNMDLVLDINVSDMFYGSTTVVITNITDEYNELARFSSSAVHNMNITQYAGDLIRISSYLEGGGSVSDAVASHEYYQSHLEVDFAVVPEPGTLVLIMIGCVVYISRGH